MCDLGMHYKPSSSGVVTITGFKVVAMCEGKHYSISMGFCYDDYEMIPIVKEQKRISNYFRDDILTKNPFRDLMVGRTAVFLDLYAAARLLKNIFSESNYIFINDKFKFIIKRANVSIDLLSGTYNDNPVVAGRKIDFFEEIDLSHIRKY